MKTTPRRRNSGAVILVIVVLIFMLLFLGYTLWQIWKIIQGLPAIPPNKEQISGEMLEEFQSAHPDETVTPVSTNYTTVTTVQPFDTTNVTMRIWRSTNLVDWQIIGTNIAGESWTDTSAPWPAGFYKQEPIEP